jgi:hypothetical protein
MDPAWYELLAPLVPRSPIAPPLEVAQREVNITGLCARRVSTGSPYASGIDHARQVVQVDLQPGAAY